MRGFRGLHGWLFALALFAAAGAIGYLTYRHDRVADWSHEARSSLSPESRAVLDALKGPVEITSYANPQGDLRQTTGASSATSRCASSTRSRTRRRCANSASPSTAR